MSQKEKAKKKFIIFHPFLFAIFPVVVIYSQNLNLLLPKDIIFPLLLFLGFAVGIWSILHLIFKDLVKTGLITSLSIFLFFAYGHITSILYDSIIKETTYKEHIVLLIVFLFVLIIIGRYFIKTKRSLNNATTITSVIAISLFIFPLATTGSHFFQQDYSIDEIDGVNTNFSTDTGNFGQLPDIYFIILDSYADYNILKDLFNFDNIEFLSYLSEKDFFVQEKTFSNYPSSPLSIPSMLNMEYINYLTDEVGVDSSNRYLVHKMIDNNKAMQIVKSKGYVTVNLDSGWQPTRYISTADLNLCGKNQLLNSQVIVTMIRNSMLNPIYVKIFESDYRDRILCIFSKIPEIQHELDHPAFIFSHILLPHGPYYWGPNGEHIIPEKATLEGFSQDIEGYTNQLQFTNNKVKEMIDKILTESDIPPVIIIVSDHGTMLNYNSDNVTDEFIKERMSAVQFIYLPGEGKDLLYHGMTPVNTLRIVFNSYLGENFDYLEDRNYFSTDDALYKWLDVTEFLRENKEVDVGFFND